MRIDIVTLFPEMCENILNESIIGRARARGYLQVCCHQLRDHGEGVHKRVDDCTFGGGKGMLLMAQPIAKAFDEIIEQTAVRPHIVYMSPRGRVLDQEKVKELAKNENIIVLCGHYEGVDERVLEEYDVEEISIGDFVLTGGELPAVILTDAVARMLPGVLSEDVCFEEESHYDGLLEISAVYPSLCLARQRGAAGAFKRPPRKNQKMAARTIFEGHAENPPGPLCKSRADRGRKACFRQKISGF